jgi:hypothetical protein
MDDRRMPAGHALAFVASLASLAALWMPWFTYSRTLASRHEVDATAWQLFGTADVVLAGAGVMIAVALLWADVHLEVASQIAAWGGAAMAFEVIWKLLNPPFVGGYGSPDAGAWVALAAGMAICAGGTATAVGRARSTSPNPRDHAPRRLSAPG